MDREVTIDGVDRVDTPHYKPWSDGINLDRPVLNIRAVKSADILNVETDMLCCMIPQIHNQHIARSAPVPALEGLGSMGRVALDDLRGELGRMLDVYVNNNHVLLAGLGPAVPENGVALHDAIRNVAGNIAKKAKDGKFDNFAVVCPDVPGMMPDEVATQIVEGCHLALYNFDWYKSDHTDTAVSPGMNMTVVSESDVADVVRRARIVSEGVWFARNVANMPPNECPPAELAHIAVDMAKECGMECSVISEDHLRENGFGGITAVGQGSSNPPRLIILEYKGGEGPPVALVGKAVTFDTGGISIKPGEKMDEMKFDKCGGCNVLGIMMAASRLKLPMNLVGLIPSVENMPGGRSYRPGDIIRLYGGTTAEILNTDAEGRLILSDALTYAERQFSPQCIIDFATLTGACIVALGCDVAGMVSNSDEMAESVYMSGTRTAEKVWRLPLDDDYMDMIKSKVADIKNMGTGRAAGTIAAAAFLRTAIHDTPWLHLDIAGTAWMQQASKKRSYKPPGATGFGVRLILDYLQRTAPA